MHDKSEDGEFFLEIASTSQEGAKRRRICVIDIEDIEPLQGTKFLLKYYQRQTLMGTNIGFRKEKMLKSEQYQSKHLADIMDCFE